MALPDDPLTNDEAEALSDIEANVREAMELGRDVLHRTFAPRIAAIHALGLPWNESPVLGVYGSVLGSRLGTLCVDRGIGEQVLRKAVKDLLLHQQPGIFAAACRAAHPKQAGPEAVELEQVLRAEGAMIVAALRGCVSLAPPANAVMAMHLAIDLMVDMLEWVARHTVGGGGAAPH